MKKIVFIFLFLTACASSKPSNFYTIVPATDIQKINSNRRLFIGVDTVSVANYLNRPQIVTKKDSNVEVKISEIDRWPEPLSNLLQRTIAENLSNSLNNVLVKPINSNRKGFDYVIFIELNKLDAKFNDKAYIDLWWFIVDKSGKVVVMKNFKSDIEIGDNYIDLVEKESKLIERLSIEIAKQISKL